MTRAHDISELDDQAFRLEIRRWVEANYPPELRFLPYRVSFEEGREWYMALSRKGWLCPLWPKEHGGMGLTPAQYMIYTEEFEHHGVARMPDQGIVMIGPLLMKHGTKAQQDFHLPRIISGEHIWCQGYSEPNAGSDLASLATSAVVDGKDFVVNGQKTWCSLFDSANWIYLLVRTDKSAKSQQAGISFLLCDISTPGISSSPIKNIMGDSEFFEVFFDDVRIPIDNVVGTPNNGWSIAKSQLGFERVFVGNPRLSGHALNRLHLLAEELGAFKDAAFNERYQQLRLDVYDLSASYQRYADVLRSGGSLGADVSILKIFATETFQRIAEEMINLSGDFGGYRDDLVFGDTHVDVMNQFLQSRPTTIYAGSNEIQRNIIAKRVLGL